MLIARNNGAGRAAFAAAPTNVACVPSMPPATVPLLVDFQNVRHAVVVKFRCLICQRHRD
jgi:hypothetical protein